MEVKIPGKFPWGRESKHTLCWTVGMHTRVTPHVCRQTRCKISSGPACTTTCDRAPSTYQVEIDNSSADPAALIRVFYRCFASTQSMCTPANPPAKPKERTEFPLAPYPVQIQDQDNKEHICLLVKLAIPHPIPVVSRLLHYCYTTTHASSSTEDPLTTFYFFEK